MFACPRASVLDCTMATTLLLDELLVVCSGSTPLGNWISRCPHSCYGRRGLHRSLTLLQPSVLLTPEAAVLESEFLGVSCAVSTRWPLSAVERAGICRGGARSTPFPTPRRCCACLCSTHPPQSLPCKVKHSVTVTHHQG